MTKQQLMDKLDGGFWCHYQGEVLSEHQEIADKYIGKGNFRVIAVIMEPIDKGEDERV